MLTALRGVVARHATTGAFGLGLLMPLGFAPFEFYPVPLFCVAALMALLDDVTPVAATRRGFAFGTGTFLAGTYWLYISIHIFGQAPVALAVFLMLALVLIMGAYFAFLGLVYSRWLAVRQRVIRWLVILPALWVLIEWLRGFLFSGFPWLSVGYAFIDSPLGGWAPLLGVYGVSAVAVVTSGALLLLFGGDIRQRAIALVVVALLWAVGFVSDRHAWTRPTGERLEVSLVQGAISQDLKWAPEQLVPTMELYRDLTLAHLSSDLVVWPEAAIPSLFHLVQDYLLEIQALAKARNTAIMLGMLRQDPISKQYENSLILLGETPQVYTKRHLVPFGEYFPVPDFVRRWMRLMSLPYSDTAAGDPDQLPFEFAGQKVGASICYEDAFGAEQLVFLPQATLLVNVSNDAWFGDSIAPHQHLQISRMRAKEAGRFLLRSTNTGISAVIDERGVVRARAPQFETRVLAGQAQPFQGATPYVRVGNWPIVGVAALLSLLAFLLARRRVL